MIIEKDNKKLEVIIEYKRIKNLYIRVKNNQVYVTSSVFFDKNFIIDIINKNFDKYYKLTNKEQNLFSYLGRQYKVIEIKDKINKIEFIDDKCYIHYKKNIEEAKKTFYIEKCKEQVNYFYGILEDKFNKYGISCNKIHVGVYKSIWGSCNKKTGIIKINAYLMRYDLTYLECILHHEYCHFKYQNHQKEYHLFYDLMFPGNRKIERNLKKLPSY